jgi:hypothetical protein
MDPYLEQPELWPNVHSSLIIAMRDDLAPRLRPRYYVSVEERTYITEPPELAFSGRPDLSINRQPTPANAALVGPAEDRSVQVIRVELPLPDLIRETYLEVRSTATGALITAIELLSPTNKRPGKGRTLYRRKRSRLLDSNSHLVEIDLLRAGKTFPMRGAGPQTHYRILLSRAERRPQADLLPFNVRQPIPSFYLPLVPGDPEPVVDLNRLLHELYDRAGYDLRLNYRTEPDPALNQADSIWADALLRAAGLR